MRKVTEGALYNKERTKLKLLTAVGDVIRDEGYTGLRVNHVAKIANVSNRLIYAYFGTFENLVETYIRGKDYWIGVAKKSEEIIRENEHDFGYKLSHSIFQDQLDSFYNDKEMQQIVRWQICERSDIMFEICETREELGKALFHLTDPYFKNTDVDLRAISGLLVGGIYFMVLHAKTSDSLFCGIDMNTTDGMDRVKKAIEFIIECAYKSAKKKN